MTDAPHSHDSQSDQAENTDWNHVPHHERAAFLVSARLSGTADAYVLLDGTYRQSAAADVAAAMEGGASLARKILTRKSSTGMLRLRQVAPKLSAWAAPGLSPMVGSTESPAVMVYGPVPQIFIA